MSTQIDFVWWYLLECVIYVNGKENIVGSGRVGVSPVNRDDFVEYGESIESME